METTVAYWGDIGITEKKMETTIVHWDYIGILEEKKMETTGSGRILLLCSEVWPTSSYFVCT